MIPELPRVSVRSIMMILIVVALDCVVYRSIATRPDSLTRNYWEIALATVPMVNLLAVVIARLARGRLRDWPFGLGFALGGWIAVLTTIFAVDPALDWIDSSLESTSFGRWLEAVPIRIEVAFHTILVVPSFLSQFTIAMITGNLARWFALRHVTRAEAERPVRGGYSRSLALLLILASLPALAIERTLRAKVDPLIVRRSTGSKAIVNINPNEFTPGLVAKGSFLEKVAGNKVRVENDNCPTIPQFARTTRGTTCFNDLRAVEITFLEGENSGKTASLPYCFLQPIP